MLVGLGAAFPSTSAASLQDYVNTGSFNDLDAAERRSIVNALWEGSRDDLAPYRAGVNGVSGGDYKPERLGRALGEHLRAIPNTAPGAKAVQTQSLRAQIRSAMLPRSWVGKGLGTRVAMRAVPGIAGGFVLWEIGSALLGSHKTVRVEVANEVTSDVEFRWSGDRGRCGATGATVTEFNDRHCTSGTSGGQTFFKPYTPEHVLQLQTRANGDPGASFVATQECRQAPARGPVYGPWGLSPPSSGTCTHVEPFDYTQDTYDFSDGLTAGGDRTGIESTMLEYPAGSGTLVQHWRTVTNFGQQSWFLDLDFQTDIHDAIRDGDDPAWSGVSDTDASRVKSTPTAAPDPTTATNEVETQLAGPDAKPLREQIAYAIGEIYDGQGGSGSAYWSDPTAGMPTAPEGGPAYGVFTMPSCVGLQASECESALASAGHTGAVVTTVRAPLEADVAKPGGAVVTTNPAEGATVSFDADVELDVNPAPEDMPLAVPEPLPGETATEYVDRLQALGLVGSVTVLTDVTLSPDYGPNEVVSVEPEPGTLVATGDGVNIIANPPTAPVPGAAGGCDPWAEPTLNLNGLRGAVPTNVLPFGLVFWLVDQVEQLAGDAAIPEFHFDIDAPLIGHQDVDIVIDWFDEYIDEFRTFVLIGCVLSFVLMLYSRAAGLSRNDGDA